MAPLGRVGLLGSTFQSFRADLPSVYHYLLRIMCVRHYTERIYDALDFWRNKTGLPHFVNTVFSKETVSVTIILIIKTRKCREKMEKQEIVCYCSNVTKKQILNALDQGAKTLNDIRRMTGACTKGNCKELSPRKT